MNVERRHLTEDQLLVIQVSVGVIRAREAARQRQAAGGGDKKSANAKSLMTNSSEAIPSDGTTVRAQIAKATGASEYKTQQALNIQKVAPNLLREVRQGTMTLLEAQKRAKARAKARRAKAETASDVPAIAPHPSDARIPESIARALARLCGVLEEEVARVGAEERRWFADQVRQELDRSEEWHKIGRTPTTPTLNPDGVSVKGCTYIYAPKGQAGEYSALATNPYRGCGHGCAYCYVPSIVHMRRPEFDAGATPRENFLAHLIRDAKKYQQAGITQQVMLSFTTDPYHPGDTSLTRDTLKILQAHGLGICTLTKGGRRAMRDMELFRPGRDAFASTLTSLEDAFSQRWERNAALPQDRLDTLREFHEAGIFTWVSLEPVLDTAATLEIIRKSHRFVDLYKVGRANYIRLTRTTDWRQFTEDVLRVLAECGARHYIKQDLQPYLPDGYDNPKRVKQFRADGQDLVQPSMDCGTSCGEDTGCGAEPPAPAMIQIGNTNGNGNHVPTPPEAHRGQVSKLNPVAIDRMPSAKPA
jgi:DNA repair photolyase